jgi:hypothetical protein
VVGGARAWKGEEEGENACGGDWARDSPFYRGRGGGNGGRDGWATAVIGTFMAAITGSEGGGG